jgi:hypothetical protein
MLVDNPILNSPFKEPSQYWAYAEGQPVLREGRRPAGYYPKARTRGPQMAMPEEKLVPLDLVNTILFRTVRPCVGTTKSHVSHVVLDAPKWEHSMAYQLEQMPEVIAYARNDHLDFTIPYEWQGARHEYRPDYLIRWRCEDGREVKIILEVKGFETEQDRQKEIGARRWVRVVNHHGEFGRWEFVICRNPVELPLPLRQRLGRRGARLPTTGCRSEHAFRCRDRSHRDAGGHGIRTQAGTLT